MDQSINLYAVAGLAYDIVGAVVLAEAIAATRTEILVNQARHRGQFSTGNLSLFAALEDQRHDARFGLVFLVGGFALQLLPAFGYSLAATWRSASFLATPLVVGLCVWQIWCCRLARTRYQRFLDTLDSRLEKLNFIGHNPEEPPSRLCARLERVFGISRQPPVA